MAVPVVVSTEWLNQQITQCNPDKIRVLDVTWYSDRDAMVDFAKRHIPGAVFYNLFRGVESTSVYPRKLADAATFEVNARGAGVDKDTHVVLCDGCEGRKGFFTGPRVWLMFKIYGHDKVSVLDGGLEKWIADGYETTNMCMKIAEGNFESAHSTKWQRSYDDMVEILPKADIQVCDSRPRTLYDGNTNDLKSGHCNGAVNIPQTMILDQENNCLKDTEDLKQVFREVGIDLHKPLTTMCNGGMSSCSLVMAAHMCGCPDATVYLGGFNEWKNRADVSNIYQS